MLCRPRGARRGQPGVPNKLLGLLLWEMPCGYVLTGPGWENAHGRGSLETREGPKKAAVNDYGFIFLLSGNMILLAHLLLEMSVI